MAATKIALITDCSSGIGLDIAVTLARDPRYVVYATARDLSRTQELERQAGDTLNKNLFVKQLDVTKEDQIKTAVAEIKSEWKRIDILVNNAGVSQYNAVEHVPLERIRAIFDVNAIGAMRLTQEVIPMMKQNESGRILFISSVMGTVGYPFSEFYCATKFAVEGFAEAFAPVGRQFNIWVSLIQPGPVKTELFNNVSNKGMGAFWAVDEAADSKTKRLAEVWRRNRIKDSTERGIPFQESSDVTKVFMEAVEADKPRLRYLTSPHFIERNKKKYSDTTGEAMMQEINRLLSE